MTLLYSPSSLWVAPKFLTLQMQPDPQYTSIKGRKEGAANGNRNRDRGPHRLRGFSAVAEAPAQSDASPGASCCEFEGSRAPAAGAGGQAQQLERTADSLAGRAHLDFARHRSFCGA